jgi:hypothetical protein
MKKGTRNRNEKSEKRPPSHVAMEAIQSMTSVMMCRSCGMKFFCPSPMQCKMEALLESKIAMLSEKMGEENVKKLTPHELLIKMREIPDEESIKFMEGVLNNVSMDKEESEITETEEPKEPEETEQGRSGTDKTGTMENGNDDI